MAGLSREDVSRRLIETGLMSPADAEQALNGLPHECDPTSELVSRKLLTEFQASVLGSGEFRTLVLGNYIVQDRLGGGGMGVVFLAKHRRMKRVVALKVLSPSLMGDDEAIHRFQREVELLSRLQHQNIATAYDADETDGVHFLVMEYVNGWDLRTLVRRDGPLSIEKTLDCMHQAAQGLAFAHRQGIIHRDVKPSNLLVDSSGTVKVLDLGLARLKAPCSPDGDEITETEITAAGTVMGTATYMAPEQGADSKAADERSDIYSLGCTLFFALTGQPPVSGDTTMQKILAHQMREIRPIDHLRPDVPHDVCRVLKRMTEKDPEDRYQGMEEVVVALARLKAQHGPAGPAEETSLNHALHSPPTDREGARTWFTRRMTALVGVLLTAVVLAVFANRDHDAEDPGPSRPPAVPGEDGSAAMTEFADIVEDFQWWDFVAFLDESRAVCGGGYFGVDDSDYPLIVWRLSDGAAERELPGPTSWVWCGDVSPDGRYLLAGTGPSPSAQDAIRPGGTESDVFVWDLNTGSLVSHFQEHGDTVRAAAFLSDSERIISGGYDATLRLWSIATGEQLHEFENPKGEVLSVAASPDGNWIASGHWGGVELWNAETLAWERQFEGRMVLALAFSTDGRYLAIGGGDGAVLIVDLDPQLDEPGIVTVLPAHMERVKSLAWLPGGRHLVSSSDEGKSVRLWDVLAGKQVPWFDEVDCEVKSIAVSPSGHQVLTACADGTVQLWELPPEHGSEGGGEEQHPARTPRD